MRNIDKNAAINTQGSTVMILYISRIFDFDMTSSLNSPAIQHPLQG